MIKFFHLISYYILLLLGLVGTSWIIWSRFIRSRTIRDIPNLLTEYRFWLLLYICCIYLYAIKTLIKENNSSINWSSISNAIWKPFITLDHAIKYNKYTKKHYYNLIDRSMRFFYQLSDTYTIIIILCFQVIPRIILVTFLFADTFYFHKLEILYKIILIGVIPFLFRYFTFCFKDIYDYWIKCLSDKYSSVHVFEKGYEFNISRVNNTEAVWHYDKVPIEQYIEIMHDTCIDKACNSVTYEYIGIPYSKEDIYKAYEEEFKKPLASWTSEDYKLTGKLFEDLIPKILELKILLNNFRLLKKEKIIVWPKILIYSIYFICWSYILCLSYIYYPIELKMFNNLIINFTHYLCNLDDPFSGNNLISMNKNLITIESVNYFIRNILIKIFK